MKKILAETVVVESIATEAVKSEDILVQSIAKEAVNAEAEVATEADILMEGW